MINVEIMKVCASQILPCGRVTRNKEFTIGGLNNTGNTHRLVKTIELATFTPLCVSVDGMLGCEATAFFKRIGDMLLAKWKMYYGTVMGWDGLSFVILHATLLCVWGKVVCTWFG